MYLCLFFFFNDTATTEIYTLSLHDALPIFDDDVGKGACGHRARARRRRATGCQGRQLTTEVSASPSSRASRSEEHTSELQSRQYLVCRLLLEKKKNKTKPSSRITEELLITV